MCCTFRSHRRIERRNFDTTPGRRMRSYDDRPRQIIPRIAVISAP
jgi:hypothetical protein